MSENVLEQLAATNPDAEIWWDSSPLIYPSWEAETLAKAPEGKRADWEAQLNRLYNNETIHSEGTMGFRGVTTNPPLSLQAIKLAPELWAGEIKSIAAKNPGLDVEGVYWTMYLDLVKKGAEAIRPVWDKSGGKYAWLSGQVDPRFVTDGDKMLAQGLTIAAQGPNVMVKLPGSKQGYEILEELTARGISTNNTTSFTVPQYVRCMAAVSAGLLRARAAGVDLSKWRSVITHMSARLGELSDWKTEAKARGIELTLPEIRDGEEAVLKRAYHFGKRENHPSKRLRRQRHGLHLPAGLHRRVDGRTGRACTVRRRRDRPRAEQGEHRKAAEAAELPPGLRIRRHDARSVLPVRQLPGHRERVCRRHPADGGFRAHDPRRLTFRALPAPPRVGAGQGGASLARLSRDFLGHHPRAVRRAGDGRPCGARRHPRDRLRGVRLWLAGAAAPPAQGGEAGLAALEDRHVQFAADAVTEPLVERDRAVVVGPGMEERRLAPFEDRPGDMGR